MEVERITGKNDHQQTTLQGLLDDRESDKSGA